MLRVIKFRTWHKQNKQMTYEGWTKFENGSEIYSSKCTLFNYGKNAEIMQYTGFNLGEREIYDMDILREENEEDEIFYAVVTWIKEWCMFACLIIKDDLNEYENYLQNGAASLDESMFWTFPLQEEKYGKRFLAGNIYEHSHLLKQTP